MKKYNLILGSQSPRRKELLQWSFVPYQIFTSDIEEVSAENEVEKFVMDIARQKAEAVHQMVLSKVENPFVIGADTIVVSDGYILGKPRNLEHAREILQSLSGKTHLVFTGVCFVWGNKSYSFYEETQVSFDHISDFQLTNYLETKESLDKAGAYGIQGAALGFIKEIKGCYSNVVGLPINKITNELNAILAKEDLTMEEAFND